ncbi:MAG TPA: hypothetical protein VGO38_12620 [Acidimicrobiia bacterium]
MASANEFPALGIRVRGHSPGNVSTKEAKMRSSSEQSRARPSALIRDPLAEDPVGAIETDHARDEDPIRHAWTFVIPPTPAERFAAHKDR